MKKNDNVWLSLGIVVLAVVTVFIIVFINGVDEDNDERMADLSRAEESATKPARAEVEPAPTPTIAVDQSATLAPPTLAGQKLQITGISVKAWLEADCSLTVSVDNRSSTETVLGIITDTTSSELVASVGHRARITFPMTKPPASVSVVGPAGEVLLVQPLNAAGCKPAPTNGATLGPTQELIELGADDGA